MTSPRCDHLDQSTLPRAFLDERAELNYINKQISSLDSHLSALTTLRDTLLHRSHHLHNLLSPIHTLPIEILSHIFWLLVDSLALERYCVNPYKDCFSEALTLASVSRHFRYVAFANPDLWKRVSITIPNVGAIGNASSKLSHCITLAPFIEFVITEELPDEHDEEVARSLFDALLTPDTIRKLRYFRLNSQFFPSVWTEIFRKFDAPLLNTFDFEMSRRTFDASEIFALDIQTLTTLTEFKLAVNAEYENVSITAPPSVQYLYFKGLRIQALFPLLYQCPNLVECNANCENQDDDPDLDDIHLHFPNPLFLPHLKHLRITPLLMSNTFIENLRIPSLEILDHRDSFSSQPCFLVTQKSSSTLKTLIVRSCDDELDLINLSRMCLMTFPKLETIKLNSEVNIGYLRLLQTLERLEVEDEHRLSPTQRFPTLQSITVDLWYPTTPRSLVDGLKGFNIGAVFRYDIRAHYYDVDNPWSPELHEELRIVLGDRLIQVTWIASAEHGNSFNVQGHPERW